MANTFAIGFDEDTFTDDEPLFFGDDKDYSAQYDSTSDAFEITDEDNNIVGVSVQRNGHVEFGGNVEIPNGSLSVSDASGSDFVAESGDTMSGSLVIEGGIFEFDSSVANQIGYRYNSTGALAIRNKDDSQNLAQFTQSDVQFPAGNVEILNGNLRLAKPSEIQDKTGTRRLRFTDTSTQISDNSGNNAFYTAAGSYTEINAYSDQRLMITDNEGDFTAVEYTTSSSSSGTLALPNADLDLEGNVITGTSISNSNNFRIGNKGNNIYPSFTYKNDTDTGVYSNGADNIGFSTGGNIGLNVNSNSNVQIPNGRLTISGFGGRAGLVLRGDATDSTSTSRIDFEQSDGVRTGFVGDGSSNNDDIYFGADQGNVNISADSDIGLIVNTNQNVEIPSGNLSVGPTPATSGRLAMSNTDDITSRNSGDTDDISLIGLDSNDSVDIGDTNASNAFLRAGGTTVAMTGNDFRLGGQRLTKVGGTTDAAAGAIRLANDSSISWRNTYDSKDFGLSFDSNNKFSFEDEDGTKSFVITSSGNIEFYGNARINGNTLRDIGGITGATSGAIRLASGSDIQWRNNANSADYGIETNSSDDIVLNSGGNVEIPNGDLSLTGGNLEIGVGYHININNTVDVIDSADNQQVQIHERSNGNGIRIRDRLDVVNNNIGRVGHIEFNSFSELQTGGGGSASITVQDTANSQSIAQFEEGGNVTIPNGGLRVEGENSGDALHLGGSSINAVNTLTPWSSSFTINTNGQGSNEIRLRDAANSQPIAQFNEGGNVEIPNGNLQLAHGDLQFSNNNDILGSSGNQRIYIGPTETEIRDSDGNSRFLANDGATRIRNDVGNRAAIFDSGTGHSIDSWSGTPFQVVDRVDDDVVLQYQASTGKQNFIFDADIQFDNAEVYSIKDSDGDPRLQMGTDSTTLGGDTGHNAVAVNSTSNVIQLTANSTYDVRIFDEDDSQTVFRYSASNGQVLARDSGGTMRYLDSNGDWVPV